MHITKEDRLTADALKRTLAADEERREKEARVHAINNIYRNPGDSK